ncbi:hypothetical protein X474_08220 [Dethiosulfatarculus sandiegensis]|uniref:CBS domain-containing protein n=1 Tax=Dethiosulfatarculus sandiegensis TaxID=1429043 RepID=A0A0D2JFW2_9BACT|nr:hypothetical protein X474_08220 [Dethiosulfatarculus sandiegensis]
MKDLMVPVEEYARVSEDAILQQAVLALEEAQINFKKSPYKHRAILVFNEKTGDLVGKLSQWAILKGLEPKYDEIVDTSKLSRFGFTPEFTRSIMQHYKLLQAPLDQVCQKAATLKVKDMMNKVDKNEYLDIETTLDQAIHCFVMGHNQSLMVTKRGKVVGILRLSDVFKEICYRIKLCEL